MKYEYPWEYELYKSLQLWVNCTVSECILYVNIVCGPTGLSNNQQCLLAWWINAYDVLFSNDTGKRGKRNSECSYQESNPSPSDYYPYSPD